MLSTANSGFNHGISVTIAAFERLMTEEGFLKMRLSSSLIAAQEISPRLRFFTSRYALIFSPEFVFELYVVNKVYIRFIDMPVDTKTNDVFVTQKYLFFRSLFVLLGP